MRLKSCWMSCAPAALAAGAISLAAAGDVVGYWNCNGFDPDLSTSLSADVGGGTLSVSSFGTGATVYQGTAVNALEGFAAGDAIGLTNAANNGAWAQIDVSTSGMADLMLSFAVRRSATGFGENQVQALIGGSWTTVATFNPSTTAWGTVSVDLSAYDSLENGSASLRLVFDGATSGSGTLRLDNILVTGAAVPAPGAIALLAGAAALTGARRRRRGAS